MRDLYMKLIPLGAALLSGACVLLQPALAVAADLQVPAGATRVMEPKQAREHFATWKLGDGATLVLPEGVADWRWEVERAEIGAGVRILGAGAAGEAGRDGADSLGKARSCSDGAAGQPGTDGGHGGDGANLDLRMGIAALGSLAIEVPGGAGGDGGDGGRGQDGGDAKKCPGGDGGAGGQGGAGGDAGDGGDVRIRYYRHSAAAAPVDPGAVIDVVAGPGSPGKGGRGGVGGDGGEGGYVQMRTLTGAQKWVSGGDRGPAGDPGANGESGSEGRALIESDVDRRLDRLLEQGSPTPAPAGRDRLQDLERELDAMRRRLEALEREDRH